MATKFHIKDDGTPGQCGAASAESCPKTQAGDGFHGTLAEASAESERRFEASHGAVPVSSSPASSSPVEDRRAFSTDMMDSSEYRVEGGRLKVEFEGDGYDLGELKAVSSEEVKSWSQDTFGSELELQDGEVFPLYDAEGSEAGAYMRSGDGFYRAGEKGTYEMDPPRPSSESSPAAPSKASTPSGSKLNGAPLGDPKPKLPPFEKRVEREAVDQISTLGGNYSVKERAELKRSLKARLEVSGDLSADAVRLATRKTVDEFDRSQPGWNSKGRG